MNELFRPIRLGSVEVPNRVALAPMGLGFEIDDETWSERYFPYIEERCRGETGLILTHFTNATQLATAPIVGSYADRFVATHRRLADVVHRYDSRLFLQIAALGGKGGSAAPSAIESPNYLEVPRQLTIDEIEQIIKDFAKAAARARKAGCDGVELHGAHTYLVGAFMSPHTNRRDDEYGGSFEHRMRFPVRIVRAIKREVGKDFPIGFKFSAWEELEGGVTPDLAVRIAQRMANEGVCYLHVSATSATLGVTAEFPSLPTIYAPRNTLLPLAKMVKEAVKDIPVIAGGAIDDPGEAEDMIARGDCDMVALGRGLLADPHWARKARLGQRVRPCIRCNVCYQQLWTPHASVVCTVNPYLTCEVQEPLPPVTAKKRVMIVGGGPGGMVAALTAARRGHQVTLCEKERTLGGELIPGGKPAFKSEIGRLLDYWKGELADSDVEVKLNVKVTPDLVRDERPDALVVAVGADPIIPSIPGIESPNVMTAIEAFKSNELTGKTVTVVGGGDVGCECALHLTQQGCRVTIVEMMEQLLLLEDVHSIRVDLLRMIEHAGIAVLTSTKVVGIERDRVLIKTGAEVPHSLETEMVVMAVGMQSHSQTAHKLAGECADVRIVGDCLKPRRIRDAVVEGDLAGRLV